jgi:hypothetical protein
VGVGRVGAEEQRHGDRLPDAHERSWDSATPAVLMDWHEKNADPQHDDGRYRDELERVRVK